MIVAVPMTKKAADAFVREHHRHHKPVIMDIFRVAAADAEGNIIGVAQVGHPVARMLTDGKTLEVNRLCTLGGDNVCSFLYSRCARIAREMGYRHIITYIYATEPGTSLRAAGWTLEGITKGHPWDRPSRHRDSLLPLIDKQRWGRWL